MFLGFDLKDIFTFPFRDVEARRYFMIGCLVSLAAFIIPILPYLVLFGYSVRIAKQIMNNESPRMVAWDDWGGMAKDGLKVFGIRMILVAPILVVLIPYIIVLLVFPIIMSTASSSDMETLMPIFMLITFGGVCCFVPLSIPLAVIIPGAEMHVIEKDDFSAGLRFKEWWPIFRANLGGFIAAFAITYIAATILTFVIQIIGATLILACLMFILIPAMTAYLTLIMYMTNALAYKTGRDKLAEMESASVISQ